MGLYLCCNVKRIKFAFVHKHAATNARRQDFAERKCRYFDFKLNVQSDYCGCEVVRPSVLVNRFICAEQGTSTSKFLSNANSHSNRKEKEKFKVCSAVVRI